MKTALGQLHLYWEDKQKNLEKIEQYMQILNRKDTDLFLLPEMSLEDRDEEPDVPLAYFDIPTSTSPPAVQPAPSLKPLILSI